MKAGAVAKLYSIFTTKRWFENEGHNEVFNSFCELLDNLNEVQQNLLLELIDRYLWLTYAEYLPKLMNLFKNIPTENTENLKKIILFPVLKPSDEDKTKSGHMILYLLKSLRPSLNNLKHISFQEFESYEKFEPPFSLNENEEIFLLDDFIGTGDTIKSTLDLLLSFGSIKVNQINVVSLVVQQEALDYMDSLGVKYFTEFIGSKGISDHYTSPEIDEKIRLMLEIEKLLPNKKYSFGYGKSEGLVTLCRTPNNTFPIFWQNHRKGNVDYKAPFSRY